MSKPLTFTRPTILLLGTGRSGTTWLAGLLASPFRYRLLFEPFMPHQVPGSACIADRYYEPDQIPVAVGQFCHRALDDRINSNWIAQSSNRKYRMHRWRFWPKVRICKDIRSNLFIPAYRTLFGPSLPIVVLMRHPGAVVESFLRVKFPWATDISQLRQQTAFAERFDLPLAGLQRFDHTDATKIAIRWVLENGYLLQHAAQFGVHLLFYEDLIADPVPTIHSLCDQIGIQPVENLSELVSQPSYTTHAQSPLYDTNRVITDSWQKRLTAENLQAIQAVLDTAQIRYPRPL